MGLRRLTVRFASGLMLIGWPLIGVAQTAAPTDLPVIAQVQAQVEGEERRRMPTLPEAASSGAVATLSGQAEPHALAVLVLDVDQAYVSSDWGDRAQRDIEAAAYEIEAENARMEDQLVSEEQALAAERDGLTPAEFRARAEAFDTRAQNVRRERRQAAIDLGNRAQADRNAFVEASLPLIAAIMQDRRAGVVLDRRQVLVAVNAVDITEALVERMNAEVGDGGALPDLPAEASDDGGDAASIPLVDMPPPRRPETTP